MIGRISIWGRMPLVAGIKGIHRGGAESAEICGGKNSARSASSAVRQEPSTNDPHEYTNHTLDRVFRAFVSDSWMALHGFNGALGRPTKPIDGATAVCYTGIEPVSLVPMRRGCHAI